MYNEKIGPFELKAFFDENSGDLINKVTYRRKPIKKEILNDRYSQSYIGYELIIADLKSILSWANISINLLAKKDLTPDDKAILHSLFISIVITYWKCFADSKGRHGVKLNKAIILKEYHDIHEELKKIRHNFVAHSGEDSFESGYLLLVKDVIGKERFLPFTIPIYRKASHAEKKLINNIISLVIKLIEQVGFKQNKSLANIMALH